MDDLQPLAEFRRVNIVLRSAADVLPLRRRLLREVMTGKISPGEGKTANEILTAALAEFRTIDDEDRFSQFLQATQP